MGFVGKSGQGGAFVRVSSLGFEIECGGGEARDMYWFVIACYLNFNVIQDSV